MAKYTKLNQQDIQSLADNYELKINDFFMLDGGNGNSSYVLKTKHHKYVLTVCDDKELEEVFNLGRLLLFLEEKNVPTNRLISPGNSEIMTTFSTSDMIKPVLLKDYIEGHVVERLDETMLFQVGRQLALLNKIPPPDYLQTNHPYWHQHFPNVVGLNIDPDYESWLIEEFEYLDHNIAGSLPRGLIHGDLFYDNLLFEPLSDMPTKLKAIIDFEEACNYYLIFELGMSILGTCLNDIKVNLKKARSLIDGYQTVRQLEPIEKENLQIFIRYAAAATSYWRFNKYNIKEPNENKEDHHWQMVQISNEVAKIPAKSFFEATFNPDKITII